jgi:hypothetical protein
MASCEPQGYKLEIKSVKRAANIAIKTVNVRRKNIYHNTIVENQSLFFGLITLKPETAIKRINFKTKLYKSLTDDVYQPMWESYGQGTLWWAEHALSSVTHVSDSDYVWVSGSESADVSEWLRAA